MLSEVRAYLLPTHQCITRTDAERRRFACLASRFASILLHVLCGGTVTEKDASGSCAPAYLPIPGRGSRTKPSRVRHLHLRQGLGVHHVGQHLSLPPRSYGRTLKPMVLRPRRRMKGFSVEGSALTRSSDGGPALPVSVAGTRFCFRIATNRTSANRPPVQTGPQTDIPKPA